MLHNEICLMCDRDKNFKRMNTNMLRDKNTNKCIKNKLEVAPTDNEMIGPTENEMREYQRRWFRHVLLPHLVREEILLMELEEYVGLNKQKLKQLTKLDCNHGDGS